MGTLDFEKKSKKRQRDKTSNESDLNVFDENNEVKSPSQKSPKKRKRSNQNQSVNEEPSQLEKVISKGKVVEEQDKSTQNKVHDQSAATPSKINEIKPDKETQSGKKRKRSKQNDSFIEEPSQLEKVISKEKVLEEQDKSTQNKEHDQSATTPSKINEIKLDEETKSGKKRKRSKQNDSFIEEPSQLEKEVSKEKEEEEASVKLDEENESGEKKKKRKRKKSTFGVVNSKLLEEHGGEKTRNKNDNNKSRINKAVDYLHLWKDDKPKWKFNKMYQTLLLKAVYNPIIIPDDDFETILLYFQNSSGGAKNKLKNDAMAILKEEDDYLVNEPVDPDKEKRAKEILQMLG